MPTIHRIAFPSKTLASLLRVHYCADRDRSSPVLECVCMRILHHEDPALVRGRTVGTDGKALVERTETLSGRWLVRGPASNDWRSTGTGTEEAEPLERGVLLPYAWCQAAIKVLGRRKDMPTILQVTETRAALLDDSGTMLSPETPLVQGDYPHYEHAMAQAQAPESFGSVFGICPWRLMQVQEALGWQVKETKAVAASNVRLTGFGPYRAIGITQPADTGHPFAEDRGFRALVMPVTIPH